MPTSDRTQNRDGAKARRAAAKRERRRRRQAQEEHARRRAAQRTRWRRRAIGAGLAGVIVAGGAFMFWPDPELDGVERPTYEGRDHVTRGTRIDYGSAAPTSGPHWPVAARCGVHREPVDLPLAVHALEHGAVVVWHQPDLPDPVAERLHDLTDRWDSHVLVSPNPDIDAPVVLTALDRRLTLGDDVPASALVERATEFVEVYRGRGPESIDCPT